MHPPLQLAGWSSLSQTQLDFTRFLDTFLLFLQFIDARAVPLALGHEVLCFWDANSKFGCGKDDHWMIEESTTYITNRMGCSEPKTRCLDHDLPCFLIAR
jgi:hypothetical protein